MAKYAIVNAEGVIENVAEWDGESQWTTPEGTVAVPVPDGEYADIGGTFIDGVFTRAAVLPENNQPEPDDSDAVQPEPDDSDAVQPEPDDSDAVAQ